MADLNPIPFADLVRRMCREAETSGAVFDLPERKWWVPDAKLDFSALHFSRRVSTPVGPAAGPHTQLAQNIVLAWLAGSRIIELKTVQVDDRLDIPRPCIHVPNIGFNVEWSQELRAEQSLREYAKAAYLIEILKSTRAFGRFPAGSGLDTVFDISVGYDLEGIRSDKVTSFIRGLLKPASLYQELRDELVRAPSDGLAPHADLSLYADLEPPDPISDCVTLSTFHGCPADQIESMARYLMDELGLHVIIKLNPTLLGFEAVREILHDRLGYRHLDLRPQAFDIDLQYDDGIAIMRRLRSVAERRGSAIGAKFTNTLVVRNDDEMFPTQSDPWMYVSGPPLHVIAMNLMQRFREDLGFEFPVSFSAGIDVKNFPIAVACGMVPVTTCTDLLKQGGFGRLPGYLEALGREMRRIGVTSREAYVLAARGHAGEALRETLSESLPAASLERLLGLAASGPDSLPGAMRAAAREAGNDPENVVLEVTRVAGRLNGRDVVPVLALDRRYHAVANAKAPRRIDSVLSLYDCINCDLCIPACPNDAVFAYTATPRTVATELVGAGPGGLSVAPGRGFEIVGAHQLAVFEGGCNECSNCEVYCPEEGAPFRVKERVFPSEEAFASSPDDGFWRAKDTLHARLGGRVMRLVVNAPGNRAVLDTEGLHLELVWNPLRVVHATTGTVASTGCGPPTPSDARPIDTATPPDARPIDAATPTDARPIDTTCLWRMRTAWDSIYEGRRANPVNPGGRGGDSHA